MYSSQYSDFVLSFILYKFSGAWGNSSFIYKSMWPKITSNLSIPEQIGDTIQPYCSASDEVPCWLWFPGCLYDHNKR